MTNKKTSYILGIDTGGTYTDSVILDARTKDVICFSKALTTKEHLETGIEHSINGLDFDDFNNISLVCLSTTLATNAIVENKGCKTGLVLIGKEISSQLPGSACFLAKGRLDIKGSVVEDIDPQQIAEIAEHLKGKVEAVSVSCYLSVRNPALELEARKIISDMLDVPVFCAHELSGSLGYYERTVTSVLNACLVKIIYDFIRATKSVLSDKHIDAPVMIVKGDGNLMHETVALQKPVETILSGPAASTIGATHLSGLNDAFIVDMGGTTSDIVNITNGNARICPDGAVVGGWLTRVRAANVCTYGIGGDSLITYDPTGNIMIGPEKAEPLCVASSICSNVTHELSNIDWSINKEPIWLYRKGNIYPDLILSESERKILDILGTDALSKSTIASAADIDPDHLDLESLVKNGSLIRSSITPTDILHALGRYTEFDCEASVKGLSAAAALTCTTPDQLLDNITTQISRQLYMCCLQSSAVFENNNFSFSDDESSLYLMNKAFDKDPDDFLRVNFTLNKPIVGVGAPAHAWLPIVAEKLHVPIHIPEYAQVTNAVGAALGQVAEYLSATIRPSKKEGEFILYLPKEKLCFENYDSALDYGIKVLSEAAEESASRAGGTQIEINTAVNPVYSAGCHSQCKTYIETVIEVFATAVPNVLSTKQQCDIDK